MLLDKAVLKENEIFLVSNAVGDVDASAGDGQGLYYLDTRFLSRYELRIDGMPLALLSAVGEYNFMTNLQFANGPATLPDGTVLEPRTVSVRRNRFIHRGLHERIGIRNYNRFPITLTVRLFFGSDFRDMFDVRGFARRAHYGEVLPPRSPDGTLWLEYIGRDGALRRTQILFERQPDAVEVLEAGRPAEIQRDDPPSDPRAPRVLPSTSAVARFTLTVPPGKHEAITLHVVPSVAQADAVAIASASLDEEFRHIEAAYKEWESSCTRISSDHELFNAVIHRSLYDLRLLMNRLPTGLLPVAGIPWFSVPFGRDSLITALQTLMLQPSIAYGSLRFLAAHQGTRMDDWRDEEPGKILHEVRGGEMAALAEVPHSPYYGTVDATPLFLVLLGELVRWTDDLAFARDLLPNAERALEWIERYGDLDGDGFLEFATRSERGIRNQCWKDSHDSICDDDGNLVEPPIAAVEAQGYAYDALCQMSALYARLGERERAEELARRASELRRKLRASFWMPDRRYVAQALGPDKRPVRSITSNPGHCLWSGALDPDLAAAVAERLLSDELRSGWGIRTLGTAETTFNPMSYHNGSVWPHDNSLVAAGLKRYGFDREALAVIEEVFEAALRFPDHRLPELYCGFARDRRYFSLPALYPVSCSPQAWAAGSVFLMIQTMLGLRADAPARRITLRPQLFAWLNCLSVRRLRVGRTTLDFDVVRRDGRVVVDVLDDGGYEVVVEEDQGVP